MDPDGYLKRIGLEPPVPVDLVTLERLMRAHLETVPFENLDVFNGDPVRTDVDWSYDKVVTRGRGGWCFELNGAFAGLLEVLGFDVARLGAAVLLHGPAALIDHLTLEVHLDEPYLVDVGFGDGFCRPLALNRLGPQDGGSGTFELFPSSQGTTLTRHDADGSPEPQYRFKRVTLNMDDFDSASRRLQDDPSTFWHSQAFATRFLDGGSHRVTLIGNRLKVDREGERTDIEVGDGAWPGVLEEWFAMRTAVSGPVDRRKK